MTGARSLVILAAFCTSGCLVDRSGIVAGECESAADCSAAQDCLEGRCVVRQPDAGPEAGVDGGSDAGRDGGTDGGQEDAGPGHCADGLLDMAETDVDCGGSCAPCTACQACASSADCRSGTCESSRCTPELTSIPTRTGGTMPAYVRPDGAVLLAHYLGGRTISNYAPSVAQQDGITGGASAPPGWAPDPCRESGHLAYAEVVPAGRSLLVECGPDRSSLFSVTTNLFSASLQPGNYGTVGAPGAPGWGVVAPFNTAFGRGFYGMCGVVNDPSVGGFAVCDGPGAADFSNHVVSYTLVQSGPTVTPFVGCGRTGCAGAACTTSIWVWLLP